MKNCLIIVDVQNDFCPGGALPVKDGHEVVPIINKISSDFDKVVATQDWHPIGHVSFASTHNKKPHDIMFIDGREQVLWPDHCVPGTHGADFHKNLDLRKVDLILRKGTDIHLDSYSVIFENDRKTETGLRYYLNGFNIKDLYIAGLALDYCVYYSAVDAKTAGFNVTVILDATRGIDFPAGDIEQKKKEMKKLGIRFLNHESL